MLTFLVASVSADCLPGSHATLSAVVVLSCVFWQINTTCHHKHLISNKKITLLTITQPIKNQQFHTSYNPHESVPDVNNAEAGNTLVFHSNQSLSVFYTVNFPHVCYISRLGSQDTPLPAVHVVRKTAITRCILWAIKIDRNLTLTGASLRTPTP